MALIKCKECEKEISSDAVNCPSCGAPVKPIKKKGGFLNYLKKIVITWLVIAAVFYAGFLYIKNSFQEKAAAVKEEKAAKVKAADEKFKATMAKHNKQMAEDRAKREAEAKALAEEQRAFSEAIALKIEQNKFYAILLDDNIPNIKQWAASELNDCKETIEKIKTESKSILVLVISRNNGAWNWVSFPTANGRLQNRKREKFGVKLLKFNVQNASESRSGDLIKDGVINIHLSMGGDDVRSDHILKLRDGDNSTLTQKFIGAKVKDLDPVKSAVKLCKEEFDLQQYAD
jgi:ssDNA-binding Zn-finger/Zn-ribbon topoisomerase 1